MRTEKQYVKSYNFGNLTKHDEQFLRRKFKLDKNDKRSEDRACALYRRIDPLIQELGSVRGKVEIFEKLAEQATIGGKK